MQGNEFNVGQRTALCENFGEREKPTEREGKTLRETERYTERQTERHRERHRDTERKRERTRT